MRFQKKKDAIIAEEHQRRASIIQELEKEKQTKAIELQEMIELKKLKKKKDVAISNITSNLGTFMAKLKEHDADNSMLTPETSDGSDSDTQDTNRVVIDIKDKVTKTKARLLPVKTSAPSIQDVDEKEKVETTDVSGNDV